MVITKNELRLESIVFESEAPADVSRTEDGTGIHTFDRDSQFYRISLQGKTKGHAQFAQLQARLEQVGMTVVWELDLGSYGDDVMPRFYTISNNLYVDGSTAEGTSVLNYINDTTAPSGVAPNGLLGVGDLIQFSGATYPKTYRVVSVDSSAHTYTVYPPLRETIADNTQILYGSIKIQVRMEKQGFKYNQKVNAPESRSYSISVMEDYTS